MQNAHAIPLPWQLEFCLIFAWLVCADARALCGTRAQDFSAVAPITFRAIEVGNPLVPDGEAFDWQLSLCTAEAHLCPGPPSALQQRRPAGSCFGMAAFPSGLAQTRFGTWRGVEYAQFDYEAVAGSYMRRAIVQVNCNHNLKRNQLIVRSSSPVVPDGPAYTITDSWPELKYNFHMESRCACSGGCDGREEDWGWAVICMGLLLALTYMAVGMYYNHCYRGLTGIEACPNVAFWKQLPGLVSDGLRLSADIAWACFQRLQRCST